MENRRNFTKKVEQTIQNLLPNDVLDAFEENKITLWELNERIKSGISAGEAMEIAGSSLDEQNRWFNLEVRSLLESLQKNLEYITHLTTPEHSIMTDKLFQVMATFFKKKIKDE